MSAPAAQPTRWRILAAFAAVYLIWGSTYLGIRFALESLPPLFIAGTRFLIAGTILFFFTRRQGAPLPTAANWRTALLIGGLMFFGANSAVMVAQQRVSSGMTSLLLAVVPIVIAREGW
ncbi:MAG TPA: EamA family transporter [Phototrophicaceae bacterium]|nr:EamA family transporter [Phototrophicaceae bacterium]